MVNLRILTKIMPLHDLPWQWYYHSKTKSCRQLCGTANVLSICYWIPQNCVDAVSVSTKLVEINQFCTFKDMSVESKGLHAQNCVCRNLACLCTVIVSLPRSWQFWFSDLFQTSTPSLHFQQKQRLLLA